MWDIVFVIICLLVIASVLWLMDPEARRDAIYMLIGAGIVFIVLAVKACGARVGV